MELYGGFLACIAGVLAFFFAIKGAINAVKRKRYRELQQQLRDAFKETYGILLQENVKIASRDNCEWGYFFLSAPRWEYANSDGSRDKRRKENGIISGSGTLIVGRVSVESSDPTQIVWLANTLREKGVKIKKNPAEERKQRQAIREKNQVKKAQTISGIIECFSDDPTKFEEWCADLLRCNGYRVALTPPSRDGGYDIEFRDLEGRSGLVECKCFNAKHKVGRPLIQKLVGANVSKKAERLLFMTTSSFTPDAHEYAREAGVELLDGSSLVDLNKRGQSDVLQISPTSWMLSWEDLAAMYPPDYPPGSFGF